MFRRGPEARPDFDGSKNPNGWLIFAADQRADLVRLQFTDLNLGNLLMIETLTRSSSLFQPAIHCVPRDLLDSGDRRFVDTLDAESGNLIERCSAMLESMIDGAAVPAECSATALASESSAFSPAGLVESKTNYDTQRWFGSPQTIYVWTAEFLHGSWTRSSAAPVTSKTGLKPYHMNGLQETQQQLIAEAPFKGLGGPREDLAGRQGFEPRSGGPEPPVLPLDDLPARSSRRF